MGKKTKNLSKKALKNKKGNKKKESSSSSLEGEEIMPIYKNSIDTTDMEIEPENQENLVPLQDISEDTQNSEEDQIPDQSYDSNDENLSASNESENDNFNNNGNEENDSFDDSATDSEERNFLETGVQGKKQKPENLEEPLSEKENNDDKMSELSADEENYYAKLKEKETKHVSDKVKKFLRKELSTVGNKVKRKEMVLKRIAIKKQIENKAR